MQERYSGTVKFFNPTKGFGFIISGDSDYFVHITNTNGVVLRDGQNVEFSIGNGKKWIQAMDVVVLD